ncbi:putative F-box domain-containing protein [Helianthus annuus]|nr:putative F-box domain-containing protein [Helianthus annuus]
MGVKKLRTETETTLDSLPEIPLLEIFSYLDAKHVVETSMISRSWSFLWTLVPDLNFSSDSFKQLHVFDNFVIKVLSNRQPVQLRRLTFKRGGTCNAQMVKKVFDYAFLHGVKELEASIGYTVYNQGIWMWPIWSSDSLTSLKLVSKYAAGCPFLQPRSGSFKNLTSLHLVWVIIRDLDPFSGFPELDKLRLVRCYLATNGQALNVHALQLSEFTFVYCSQDVGKCEFTTPKLRYFKWKGSGLPQLKAHFPVLDTGVINSNGRSSGKNKEKMEFDNLLMMFDTLQAAKSITLSAHVVRLLALFPVNGIGCSPFRDLRFLKLDFKVHHIYIDEIDSKLFFSETLQLVPGVKAYLLHKSPHAKCTIINYPKEESPCSKEYV